MCVRTEGDAQDEHWILGTRKLVGGGGGGNMLSTLALYCACNAAMLQGTLY